ncbi:hypothetical protein [Streptomyces sp. UNOC14_S4]|uniref:hypothetical protein n=1 Tax=Streptomyces sp. UNOC14_S4 TaxID=2872340 RepID=UPI001E5E0D1E|nr:hypothetical protein [Streptomyces sp. UNOC14_S4]MCC3766046.1 hypothetical protein [Streptomyces sp. UNOC14_S4]
MAQMITPGMQDLWMQALLHPRADVQSSRIRQWYETATARLAKASGGDGGVWLSSLSTPTLAQLHGRFALAPEGLDVFLTGSRSSDCWVMLLTGPPRDMWASGAALARDVEVIAEGCTPQRLEFADGIQVGADGSVMVSSSNTLIFGPFTGTSGSGGAISHLAVLPDPVRGDTVPIAVAELDTTVVATQGSALVIPKGGLTLRFAGAGPIVRSAYQAVLHASLSVAGGADALVPLMRHMSAYLVSQSGVDALLYAVHDDVLRWLSAALRADSQYIAAVLAARAQRSAGFDYTPELWVRLLADSPGPDPTMDDVLEAELLAPGYMPQTAALAGMSSGHSLSNPQRRVFGPFTDTDGSRSSVTHIAITSNPDTGHVIAVWPLDTPLRAQQLEELVIPEWTLHLEAA